MIELAGSEAHTLPILWWVWWFVVASAVYGLLGVWFWRRLSRSQAPVAAEHGKPDPK